MLTILFALVVTACGGTQPSLRAEVPSPTSPGTTSGAVSRAEFGDGWPLSVESGVVRCEPVFEIGV